MAVAKKVKKKEGENLTDSHIEKVIGLLAAEKPITKKEACEILNISYNTTRLAKIISEHEHEKQEEARRRAANRGKPIADHEKQNIAAWALDGDSVTEIAKRLYRSTASIKSMIEEIGVPERSEDYTKVALLPERCVAERFEVGDLIWCAVTNKIGVIDREEMAEDGTEYTYAVYEFSRLEGPKPDEKFWATNCHEGDYYPRFAAYRASNIGRLDHLKQYGIDLGRTYRPHFPRHLKIALGMEVK
jgi:DNA-binding CsgD family transcriptional regulator